MGTGSHLVVLAGLELGLYCAGGKSVGYYSFLRSGIAGLWDDVIAIFKTVIVFIKFLDR